jgi:hypothetical protein
MRCVVHWSLYNITLNVSQMLNHEKRALGYDSTVIGDADQLPLPKLHHKALLSQNDPWNTLYSTFTLMFAFQGAFKVAIASVAAFILLAITTLSFRTYNIQYKFTKQPSPISFSVPPPPERHVAVATTFTPHMTVYMPIASTIQKVLNRTENVSSSRSQITCISTDNLDSFVLGHHHFR